MPRGLVVQPLCHRGVGGRDSDSDGRDRSLCCCKIGRGDQIGRRAAAGFQFLGHQEGEFQRLFRVQAGIAERLVAGRRGRLPDRRWAPPMHSVTS